MNVRKVLEHIGLFRTGGLEPWQREVGAMLENLANRPDPVAYLVIIVPLSLVALVVGYVLAARYRRIEDTAAESAFGLAQTAIFGLIALILAFSFAFAAERFEARRALVVAEANAISTAFARAAFLPEARRPVFRRALIDYTRARLETYASVADAPSHLRSIERGKALQGNLWEIASNAARTDPRNLLYEKVADSVSETIDVADEQSAAFNNHVPLPIIGIALLSTIVGALLLGVTFGRAKAPNAALSAIFCVLFAATIFTIIDLDHPAGGFISVDAAPLQATLDDMTAL